LNLDFISYDDDDEKVVAVWDHAFTWKRNAQGFEDLIVKLKLDDLILNKNAGPYQRATAWFWWQGSDVQWFFKLSNEAQSIELRNDSGVEKTHVIYCW
jgi:hypothetical protein